MADPFAGYHAGLDSPATRHFAITPDDGTDLAILPRALWVDADGTLVIRDAGDVDVTYNVTAGTVMAFRGKRIMATGTTATVIGWY